MVMQLSRQHESCAFLAYAEKLLERQWLRDRCLASKGAPWNGRVAHVGRRLPFHQASILGERNIRG
jgi:hypothetical protein